MSLLECSTKDVVRVHKENPDAILVLVTRYFPRYQGAKWKLKGIKSLWWKDLAPTKEMLKKYKEKKKKKTLGPEKALKRVFGPAAYRFLSLVKRNKEAREHIREIRKWLNEEKNVYLICYEPGPTKKDYEMDRGSYGSFEKPCHRYLLMSLILKKRLHRIFEERKYPKRYIRWARQLGAQ